MQKLATPILDVHKEPSVTASAEELALVDAGLADIRSGRVSDLETVLKEIRQKHGLPEVDAAEV